MSLFIGGRPGGNLWSPANCKLFGITVAGITVTEGARCVDRCAVACASRCCTCCCVSKRGSSVLELEGEDGDRRPPAEGDCVSLFILFSVRYGFRFVFLYGFASVVRSSRGYTGYEGTLIDRAVFVLSGDCMLTERGWIIFYLSIQGEIVAELSMCFVMPSGRI